MPFADSNGVSIHFDVAGEGRPFVLFLGLWVFLMRRMQTGNAAMSLAKSKARMQTDERKKVTFSDVAGIDEAREELQEIVEFLKDPGKFSKLGGTIPKGALLVGSPGTGKTLLARAIAGEAGVPFFTISGSDFVEMFVGVGASRVRDMFEQAKKSAPCIVFIDEIDAVGRHRGAGLGNGNDEREQTLNQLLVEMDGFEANEGIIIIAATNRPDVLDPALLRPGRFDRQVVVPRPDIEGRIKILEVHTKAKPLAPDVDLRAIARGTPGFSGADLANLSNEAALLAARKGKRLIANAEFEEAKDKVMMGAERRSMVMTEDEKKATAYHEAGHALVSLHVEGCDPLHKVTIIPRGRALGLTWNLPERDRFSMNMKQMKARLALAFGGRIAEQLIYGKDELNTGAANDIQQATEMARAMVMEYGMSEKLGWLRYRDNQDEVFLGHSVSRTQQMSEKTAQVIDSEVRVLVEEAETRARKVLSDHIDELHQPDQAEAVLAEQVRDVGLGAGEEIVDAHHVAAHGDEPFAQVAAQEPCATRDEDALINMLFQFDASCAGPESTRMVAMRTLPSPSTAPQIAVPGDASAGHNDTSPRALAAAPGTAFRRTAGQWCGKRTSGCRRSQSRYRTACRAAGRCSRSPPCPSPSRPPPGSRHRQPR